MKVFLQSKIDSFNFIILLKKQSVVEYFLAIIGAIISVYALLPISKDGDAYLQIYENIAEHPEIEFLFRKLLELGAALEVTFSSVLFTLIFLTLLVKFKALNKLGFSSIYALVTYIAVFYLMHDCTQYRIAIALAFSLWSCIYIVERKWLYAFLTFLVGVGFHITSLVLPIVFAACFVNKTVKNLSWLFLLVGIIIFQIKVSVKNLLIDPVLYFFGGRYIDYGATLVENQNSSGFIFIYAAALGTLLSCIAIWGRISSRTIPDLYSVYLACCVYGCGLIFVCYEAVAFASRLSDVLTILIVPLLAIVISNFKIVFQLTYLLILPVVFVARVFQLFVY